MKLSNVLIVEVNHNVYLNSGMYYLIECKSKECIGKFLIV